MEPMSRLRYSGRRFGNRPSLNVILGEREGSLTIQSWKGFEVLHARK